MPKGWEFALGRLLIAQLFFVSAYNKAFVDPFARLSGRLAQKGFPFPDIFAYLDIGFEFVIAALMLAGWRTKYAAWAMIAFCVVAGLLFHDFWNSPAAQMYGQTTQLLKNLSTIGGLIWVAHYGAGPLSLDERQKTAPAPAA